MSALISAVLVAFLAGTVADAQVLYGSIVGNVTDSTGAAVPGATVTIEQAETKLTRELVADAAGAYHFTAVPSGTYSVTVTMNGFRSFSRKDVPVTLNSVARVDAKLDVGQLAETVSVSAESPILQTDRAEVRAELKTRELTELPVPIGRNYQQLFKTLPGFTPPADAHSIPSNPSRALVFNVNGSSDSSNNTRIDGVSTTNVWLPHVAAYVPALESLETVNVVTNSFDAEQGLAGGSAINVQIKSGTNQLKGSAFEYYTNEQMRELNYFAPANATKGDWAYHQFGATLGGPILRNKLFYFGSYESTRDKQNATRTISVPSAALRRGDLSGSVNPIYDPATGTATGTGRTPFAGQHHSPGSHRPDCGEDHRPDADAERAGNGGERQLLRRRAVRVQPVDARHEGELERHIEVEHLRPLQPPRLLDVQRSGVRRHAAGSSNRWRQPRNGSGLHSQLFGGRHLRALAQPRRRRALRLRADVHRRRAHRYRPEQRAVDCSGFRVSTARVRSKGACPSSTSTPSRTSESRSCTCRTPATTISIRPS